MTMVSAGDRTWQTGALDHSVALQVVLLEHTYVLPWTQFLYAEGCGDEVRLIFATHDVLVKGSNLEPLLAAIAVYGLARLQEPTRLDRFVNAAGPIIRKITVQKVEQDRA
jgi:hypothetical protein